MSSPVSGPLAGDALPMHGGRPDRTGCNGCIDCCHLPEISVTDEEADRLRAIHETFEDPLGELVIREDPANEGWQIMAGPCVFRQYDRPLSVGGCRIYEDRPSGCRIFTCQFLLELRRLLSPPGTPHPCPSPSRGEGSYREGSDCGDKALVWGNHADETTGSAAVGRLPGLRRCG